MIVDMIDPTQRDPMMLPIGTVIFRQLGEASFHSIHNAEFAAARTDDVHMFANAAAFTASKSNNCSQTMRERRKQILYRLRDMKLAMLAMEEAAIGRTCVADQVCLLAMQATRIEMFPAGPATDRHWHCGTGTVTTPFGWILGWYACVKAMTL